MSVKRICMLIPALVVVLSSCPLANQGGNPVIILEYLPSTASMNFFWGSSGGTSKIEWCQGFQIADDDTCSAVALFLNARSGAPTGNYTINIETHAVDRPSGTLADPAATRSIPASSLTDDAWNTWTFGAHFNLSAGTTYWIVCRTSEPVIGENRIQCAGDSTDLYPDGDVAWYTDGAYTVTYDDKDMLFRIYR